MKKVLVTIYVHPEYYPPTLNAINELSLIFDEVVVVTRNLAASKWKFPENVSLKEEGALLGLKESMVMPFHKKIRAFVRYVILLHRNMQDNKIEVVMANDPIALFSYWLLHKMNRYHHLSWYHNHDIIDRDKIKKYSLTWLAAIYEKKAFKILDLLTVPAKERLKQLPMDHFNGDQYFLPNWPLATFYKQFYIPKTRPNKEIKLLYQGTASKGHGLEEIVEMLDSKIAGRDLSLTLIGNISEQYKDNLTMLAKDRNVLDRLYFRKREQYAALPLITRDYDIGLAIHEPKGVIYSTAGTASNKIYEYAALGLPILLFDDEHYNNHLSKYPWTRF
ncbi:MAG TPA: hypothetical protein EYN89_00105, partial [Flavobacteriales bacterium]|nr:hypothetical protein [Flavobacteriales bacterium]